MIEDRIARANRTRPHQLNLDELIAGTSEVEFYREVQGDPGWRGPALLLRLDADEGVACGAVPGEAVSDFFAVSQTLPWNLSHDHQQEGARGEPLQAHEGDGIDGRLQDPLLWLIAEEDNEDVVQGPEGERVCQQNHELG